MLKDANCFSGKHIYLMSKDPKESILISHIVSSVVMIAVHQNEISTDGTRGIEIRVERGSSAKIPALQRSILEQTK
jgi:hypothetical protein